MFGSHLKQEIMIGTVCQFHNQFAPITVLSPFCLLLFRDQLSLSNSTNMKRRYDTSPIHNINRYKNPTNCSLQFDKRHCSVTTNSRMYYESCRHVAAQSGADNYCTKGCSEKNCIFENELARHFITKYCQLKGHFHTLGTRGNSLAKSGRSKADKTSVRSFAPFAHFGPHTRLAGRI